MKKLLCLFIALSTFVGVSAVNWPTKVVKVEPDKGINIGALNDAIATNGGECVYELKRGGTYILNGSIQVAHPLYLRAEEGIGNRPIIQAGVDDLGASSSLIRLSGNGMEAAFKGLYLTGLDELGNIVKNITRFSGDNRTITFDNCYFDYDAAAFLRIEGKECSFYITNCIARNGIDQIEPNNGRFADVRNNVAQDLIHIENCTFYNLSSQILRLQQAPVNKIIFNNNTVYDISQNFAPRTADTVYCTNNIFYNCGLFGTSTASSPMGISIDSLAVGADDSFRSFDFKSNIFFREDRWDAAMTKGESCTNDLFVRTEVWNNPALEYIKAGKIDTTGTLRIEVPFTKAPTESAFDFIKKMWEICIPSSTVGNTVPPMRADEDPSKIGEVTDDKAYNFGFAKTHVAATASTIGGPVGDLNWHPYITSIEQREAQTDDIKIFLDKGAKMLNVLFLNQNIESFVIKVYGANGGLVSEQYVNNTGQNKTQFTFDGLQPGIYVCYVEAALPNNKKFIKRTKIAL